MSEIIGADRNESIKSLFVFYLYQNVNKKAHGSSQHVLISLSEIKECPDLRTLYHSLQTDAVKSAPIYYKRKAKPKKFSVVSRRLDIFLKH